MNFPGPLSPVTAEEFTSATTGQVSLALTRPPAPCLRPQPTVKHQLSLLWEPKGGVLHGLMHKSGPQCSCHRSVSAEPLTGAASPAVSLPLRGLGGGGGQGWTSMASPCVLGARTVQASEGASPLHHAWSTKPLLSQRSS